MNPFSAIFATVQTIFREIRGIFAVPLAFFGGFFGMILMSGGLVAFFLFAPKEAEAEEEDEWDIPFEPGAIVKIGKEYPEDMNVITEETRVVEDTPEEVPEEVEEVVDGRRDGDGARVFESRAGGAPQPRGTHADCGTTRRGQRGREGRAGPTRGERAQHALRVARLLLGSTEALHGRLGPGRDGRRSEK